MKKRYSFVKAGEKEDIERLLFVCMHEHTNVRFFLATERKNEKRLKNIQILCVCVHSQTHTKKRRYLSISMNIFVVIYNHPNRSSVKECLERKIMRVI